MFSIIRSIAIPGSTPFTQVEGVYHSREEAENMIPILQKTVENPNGVRMSYQIVDSNATNEFS